ncbi:roadblock/LC7 domain-containing protein [bacterium]|nr:MAG: roadblock/LC7 domain-containing protein [bacterium]
MSFEVILQELAEKIGADGAVMLDYDAEKVASYSESTTSDIDLIGAHHAVILNIIKGITAEKDKNGDIKSVIIMTENAKLLITAIKDGYCLIIAMGKNRSTSLAVNEAEDAVRQIELEMG